MVVRRELPAVQIQTVFRAFVKGQPLPKFSPVVVTLWLLGGRSFVDKVLFLLGGDASQGQRDRGRPGRDASRRRRQSWTRRGGEPAIVREDFSDHHYENLIVLETVKQPNWAERTQEEWDILEYHLPGDT